MEYTRSGPDEHYLREQCGGVPSWEVAMLVDPAASAKPLSAEEHDRLLAMADRAYRDGEAYRANTLAEQAYTGSRALSTLLYLLDTVSYTHLRAHET